MEIKLFEIREDDHGMPVLAIEKKIDYKLKNGSLNINNTIKALCKLTNMQNKYTESFYIAIYDIYKKLIGFFQIATGGRNNVQYSKKIIATAIILTGGCYFKAFHNHQINGYEASDSDKNCVYDLSFLSSAIEVTFTGSYIITKDKYTEVDVNKEEIWYDIND